MQGSSSQAIFSQLKPKRFVNIIRLFNNKFYLKSCSVNLRKLSVFFKLKVDDFQDLKEGITAASRRNISQWTKSGLFLKRKN